MSTAQKPLGSLLAGGQVRRRKATTAGAVLALAAIAWIVSAVALTPMRAAASESARLDERSLLRDSLAAFDAGVLAAAEGSDRSTRLLRQASDGFEALRIAGVRSAALEYNLGNTYFRLGELGRAVLHFRRAALLAPRDERIRANLAYVQERVSPRIVSSGSAQLVDRLMFWSRGTTAAEKLLLTALFSAVGWTGLLLSLRWRAAPLSVGSLVIVGLGLANAGLLVWELHSARTTPAAVIVQGTPQLRHGRGEAYELVRRDALGPGVELRVLEVRGDWLRVELADGQSGWLPAGGIERL